jgi:MATE family multidrug resistance protein
VWSIILLFIGHLGTNELAAAGLGNNYFSILQHPVVGTFSALDTLLSQAFGAKKMQAYRTWVQLGLLICCFLSVPWVILLAVAEPILLSCGVELVLAKSAARYCSGLITHPHRREP